MRNLMIPIVMSLLVVAPATAQDTTVMIQNSDCTVKVDGKRLPAAEEKQACERMRASADKMQVQAKRMQEQSVKMQRDAQRMQGDVARMTERAMTQERALAMTRERSAGAAALQPRLRELELTTRASAGRLAELNGMTARAFAVLAARPRFGITIDTRPRDSDKYGAYVTAVTPGGPADKAGVRSGDIITKLAGKAVTAQGDVTPGLKLIEMIGSLEMNKAIEVELRRGKDTKTVKVTPADDESFFAGATDSARAGFGVMVPHISERMMADSIRSNFTFEVPSFGATRGRYVDGDVARVIARNGDPLTSGSYSFTFAGPAMPFGSLEMAPLNSGLGSYFGATEGVLIINAGEKQELGLLPGDVVTAVDGRKVTNPGQLMRILRTYDAGEEFKLQIMRQKRAETVTGKMP